MEYVFKTLRPQPGLVLDVRYLNGQQRRLEVVTTVIPQQRILDMTGAEGTSNIWDEIRQEENEDHLGRARFAARQVDDVGILRLPSFEFDKSDVDSA